MHDTRVIRNRKPTSGSIKIVAVATVVMVALGALAQQAPTGSNTGRTVSPQTSERTPQAGYVYVPESSKEKPEDVGRRAHTTYVIHSVNGEKPTGLNTPRSEEVFGPLSITEVAETPASLGCLYVNSPSSAGCVPNYSSGTGGPSAAGYGAIALVDAFDNPDAASDLKAFDTYWGLAPAHFIKVLANDASAPAACQGAISPDSGWSVESSLDIEWAHVFAPKAATILVEAHDNSWTCLLYAEQVAFNYIVAHYPAGGQVSNSWQGGEFAGQPDLTFADFSYNWVTGYKTPILAFESSGDGGAGVGYPSTNPWVISAGGTSILRDASTKNFSAESCWGGSGGGASTVEQYQDESFGPFGPWTNYQYPIFGGVFGAAYRETPDLSFDADPSSGVWIYSQYGAGGWLVVGGTSVSSPALASIVNRANNRLGSVFLTPFTSGSDYFTSGEHNLLYSQLATHTAYKNNFYDVTTGSNGFAATGSWDACTGVGAPRGLGGK